MTKRTRPFRVLSIDGGGMRGLYAATYLSVLEKEVAKRRKVDALDVGKGFDLIVGTSTGGIIACALAAGVPLDDVVNLYQKYGREIFPRKMPNDLNFDLFCQLWSRPKYLAQGSQALERVLEDTLGQLTMQQVFDRRSIALAIPAVEMFHHRAWVFKTPHLGGHRDDNYRLVDVCLATSAAPLYRSMARMEDPTERGNYHVFIDGGLWANNPVIVGMIDALRMTNEGDRIEIFSLGTCPRPAGDMFDAKDMHRGFKEWKFGGEAAAIAIDAQQYAYDDMARFLAKHVDRDCHVVRFPHGKLPAKAMPYLDLDETSDEAMKVLRMQAIRDVHFTLSKVDAAADDDVDGNGNDGKLLASLLNDLPPVEKQEELV